MKFLIGICALVIALGLATSVYAETQSVKISGDLTIRGIGRHLYQLATPSEAAGTRTGVQSPTDTWVMSSTEVQIDADLTDNVSAVIRLGNQRDWGVREKSIASDTTLVSPAGYTTDADEFDVGVDLAYIELKEFLYSPLTLRIGRQDIWFGKGFIVGANQIDYNANIVADEYTIYNAFDAIRGTFDYDPWTIDVIGVKIWENAVGSSDDVDLYGLNVGYIFDVYNAEAESYYFYKIDQSLESWHIEDDNTVSCLGLRGSFDPIENWTIAGEGAYQWGRFVGARQQLNKRERSAWAMDISAETRHFADQYAWKPIIGAEYIYYSGDKHARDVDVAEPSITSIAGIDGTYTGWDSMYRGKFDSAYREFIGQYYSTIEFPARTNYIQTFADASFTNQHQVIVYSSIQPTDSLTCDGRIAFFWLQEEISVARDKKYIGTEFDITLTWDYTEDVSFGLLGAWFMPGKLYSDDDKIATDVVGSVKLSF